MMNVGKDLIFSGEGLAQANGAMSAGPVAVDETTSTGLFGDTLTQEMVTTVPEAPLEVEESVVETVAALEAAMNGDSVDFNEIFEALDLPEPFLQQLVLNPEETIPQLESMLEEELNQSLELMPMMESIIGAAITALVPNTANSTPQGNDHVYLQLLSMQSN